MLEAYDLDAGDIIRASIVYVLTTNITVANQDSGEGSMGPKAKDVLRY